ncbi:DMT family transporter [Limnobacter humi]|uniref:DMT family transporter n=1 Tax=Limnobacter humi TaxID=1778671 RepID=A0ABT1WG43_9BURK|nr:DMT family transporter [Limnobacter humi]MCQ8896450.1 DMT family transporter [Limnobacter humi]
MSRASSLRLLLLAMIWGCSFIFFKIAAAEIPAPSLAWMRVLCGAVFLAILFALQGKQTRLKQEWKPMVLIAAFAAALPFWLFAYAAQTISASLLVIINATAPIWSAMIYAVWTRKAPKATVVLGLLLGVCGVSVIVGGGIQHLQGEHLVLHLLAAFGAAACYGVSTNMALGFGQHIDSKTNALGCLVYATVLLTPVAPFYWPTQLPSQAALLSTVAVGVLCSGVAYMLYFRLVDDVGPTSALTVTFLIPVFGILWSVLLLGESVGWNTGAGGLLVVAGTILVTREKSNPSVAIND